MENLSKSSIKETLLLTNYIFNQLLNKVIKHFKTEHKIINNYNDSQIYGFGNYDAERPNLKNDLEIVLRGYINGKYLYNKYREASTGKPIIKLSREYKYVFFNYLGYKDVNEFLLEDSIPKKEKNKQLDLLNQISTTQEYYYVCYYYGEDNKMTKGQIVIYNNWKTFELVFVYKDQKQNPIYFNLFGNIIQENNFVHFDTKYPTDRGKIEAANIIFYVGKLALNERPILIGTYSSFDKYDHSIAGKIIMVLKDDKTSMEREANSFEFNPIITQELLKYRFIIPSFVPQKLAQISAKSPYASIFGKIPNTYNSTFMVQGKKQSFKFTIQKNHYNIISQNDNIVIENDRLLLENKGQILELHFDIIGVFLLQKVSMYFRVYDFLESNKAAEGNYSGVDINNNIVSGKVIINSIL